MPKNILDVLRIQHGVGQGGFHTCEISVAEVGKPTHAAGLKHFTYVYDCGTANNGPDGASKQAFLEWHIDQFQPQDNLVDCLFISHLDDDHFNGCRQLVQKKKVLRIVLPYLQLEDLLLLLVEGKISTDENIAELIRIVGGQLDAFGGVPITRVLPQGVDGPGPVSDRRADNNFEDSRFPDRLVLSEVQPDGSTRPLGPVIRAGQDLSVTTNGTAVPWILRPWSYKTSSAAKAKLEKYVKTELGIGGGSITTKDIDRIQGAKAEIKKRWTQIIRVAKGTYSSDGNAPSLCLYSGKRENVEPLAIHGMRYLLASRIAMISPRLWRRRIWPFLLPVAQVGWLATGDALLKHHFDEFERCYDSIFSDIGTYMPPHHGSIHNHHPRLMARIGSGIGSAVAVISARQGSPHHPHEDILGDVYTEGHESVVVTQYSRQGFVEFIAAQF